MDPGALSGYHGGSSRFYAAKEDEGVGATVWDPHGDAIERAVRAQHRHQLSVSRGRRKTSDEEDVGDNRR